MKPLREKFYGPILVLVSENISSINNRQLISIFQGLTLAGSNIFPQPLLNQFLNQYVRRIQKSEEHPALSSSEVYQFLELFV